MTTTPITEALDTDAQADAGTEATDGQERAAGTQTAVEMTQKALLFYERPVPLNRDRHRALRLKRSAERMYPFATETNAVPISGVEFTDACRYYPIVFAGQDAQKAVPSILLGVHDRENLFVDAEGLWDWGYVPAFVRRYPFVLGEKPEAEDFTVYVDEGYAGLNSEEGEALFDAQGNEADFLKHAKEFLSHYQGQIARTQSFVARLNDFGLLVDRVIQGTTASGEKYALRGFYVVDESELQRLTDAQLRHLFTAGELAWLYAHLISLRNIAELSRRVSAGAPKERAPLEQDA